MPFFVMQVGAFGAVMDDKQVVVEKVIETLKVPKEGLALSTVAWTALYLVVIFVPGISDKNFDFKVCM